MVNPEGLSCVVVDLIAPTRVMLHFTTFVSSLNEFVLYFIQETPHGPILP